MRNFLVLICSFITLSSFAQLPETRILMLDVSKVRNKLQFSNPKSIGFQKGYNNQPYFTPDSKYVLFTSNNGKGTTDIYKYDLSKKKNIRVTKTAEAEYSPKYNIEQEKISCVRVEKDTTTQHFYAYGFNGKKGQLLNNEMKTLGYYQWLNTNEIVGFLVPEPFTFCKFNINTNKCDTLAINPGRTFHNYHGKIYYVDKSDSTKYFIRIVAKENLRSKRKTMVTNPIVAQTLAGEEDFVIMNDGIILMSKNGKIFSFNPRKAKDNEDWMEVADLRKLGITNAFRLALNMENNKLALVQKAD